MAVGRVYLTTRDLVASGGKGGRVTSPALTYTSEDLERDIAQKMNLAASSDDKGAEPVAKAKVEREKEGGEMMEVGESGEMFEELAVSGKTYRVGDIVYLTARCVSLRSCDHHVCVM